MLRLVGLGPSLDLTPLSFVKLKLSLHPKKFHLPWVEFSTKSQTFKIHQAKFLKPSLNENSNLTNTKKNQMSYVSTYIITKHIPYLLDIP
jgi:hypothetical protein